MSNDLDAIDKTLVHLMIVGLPQKQKDAVLADMKNKSTPLQKRIAEKIQNERLHEALEALCHIFGEPARERAASYGLLMLYPHEFAEFEKLRRAHMN